MSYKSDMPCVCCGRQDENSVCFHHIATRKAFPEHSEAHWNKISVCQAHHNEFHSYGTAKMSRLYRSVEAWLFVNGWKVNEFGKYFHFSQTGQQNDS